MLVRLLADREPYISYVKEGDPRGSLSFCLASESAEADLEVLPAELLLSSPGARGRAVTLFAYGPVSLMAASFEAGCADYLRDPWSLTELEARAARFARLRFAAAGASLELRGSRLSILGRGEGEAPSRSLALSEGERRLLRLLVENGGRVVTRQAMALALGKEARAGSRSMDAQAARLRTRLDTLLPGLGASISSCRGLGYRLQDPRCG